MGTPIVIAKKTADTTQDIVLHSQLANRHGLIAGATGTGKTVTLKVLAESFSRIGVPVFLADAKGDVSSLAKAGENNPKFDERIKSPNIESIPFSASPVVFWDLFGEQGHPIRTTISEIGPLLLARILNLNDTQEGVLSVIFRIADDQGLLLIDFKDLKAMISYVSEHAADFKADYGNLSPASLGAIQRNLLALADQGGEQFFGEPALDLMDFLQTDSQGHGNINLLAADIHPSYMPPSCCGCFQSCLNSYRKSATWINLNWCSSLMKPICYLIILALPCKKRLNRWCV